MTNDELLTELIDALRKVNIAATDAAKNHYTARAAELETALRAQLAERDTELAMLRRRVAETEKLTLAGNYVAMLWPVALEDDSVASLIDAARDYFKRNFAKA